MQIILIVFLAYLLYRFIVGFVLPVATAASRVKKQFRDMQANQSQRTDASTNTDGGEVPTPGQQEKPRTTSGKKAPKEDYIDFEEVPSSKRY